MRVKSFAANGKSSTAVVGAGERVRPSDKAGSFLSFGALVGDLSAPGAVGRREQADDDTSGESSEPRSQDGSVADPTSFPSVMQAADIRPEHQQSHRGAAPVPAELRLPVATDLTLGGLQHLMGRWISSMAVRQTALSTAVTMRLGGDGRGPAIDVSVALLGGRIVAELRAEDPAQVERLRGDLDGLDQGLRMKGLSVGNITVGVLDVAGGSADGTSGGRQRTPAVESTGSRIEAGGGRVCQSTSRTNRSSATDYIA